MTGTAPPVKSARALPCSTRPGCGSEAARRVSSATGSGCALATTADALVPGLVPEGKRTIWQLGQVEVYDAGPNGTGYASCPPTCGNGDEAQFMRQGVFVP